MELRGKNQYSYQKILTALAKAKVRYLIAGGIAMNIHGLPRFTADLDVIVFLETGNLLKFSKVMQRLGFIPKISVAPEAFADPILRQKWIEEKNMVVFSFRNCKNDMDVIDVFVYHPRPFDQMYKAAKKADLSGQTIRAVGLEDMLFLKRKAERPKDQYDIRFLEAMLRKRRND